MGNQKYPHLSFPQYLETKESKEHQIICHDQNVRVTAFTVSVGKPTGLGGGVKLPTQIRILKNVSVIIRQKILKSTVFRKIDQG